MSPTLTAKSREDPGVAGLLRPSSLSGLGVFEQAASSSATATAATTGPPALCHFDSCMPSPLVYAATGVSTAGRFPIRLQDLAKASFKNVSAAASAGETCFGGVRQPGGARFPRNTQARTL